VPIFNVKGGVVAGAVRVVADDLKLSASHVDVHADGLRLAHGSADGQIEAAQPGVPAGSAAALNGALAKWQGDTTALFTRMVGHSTGLRSGAAAYEQTDAQSAERILDLGL
jgi:uncharacterized protein YukE